MTTVAGFLVPTPHRSQYDPDSPPITRHEGCGPTTVANGANATTGGKVSRTAAQVHALIPKADETDPNTPGWSVVDMVRAAAKLGVPLEDRTGDGWAAVVAAWNAGLTVALQGDSDQFSDATCSGTFDGNHVVLVSPATRLVGLLRQRWVDDPICKLTGRWEYEYVLHRYASKFKVAIGFGAFLTRVPKPAPAPLPVKLYPGATRIYRPYASRISVGAGLSAVVRAKPTRASAKVGTIANGRISFLLYQRTRKGQLLAGSRTWYGNRTGDRWLHSSAF